jgi:hypothetical protein
MSYKISNNQLARNKVAIASELAIGQDEMITFSAITKQGIEQLRREIAARF